MILYISLFVLTIMIAVRVQTGVYEGNVRSGLTRQGVVNRICLWALFTLLFVVSALRFRTGNDYEMYIDKFHDAYYDYYVVTEPGFNFLSKFIYALFNGEYYLVIFAVFSLLTVGIFLKAIHDNSKDFAMSFFLFMAFGLYFQSLNTVRYYLALAIVLYSMKYVINSEYWKFIILVLAASLFHKTALIVIPLYLLARINWKVWQLAVMGVLSLTGFVFSEFYLKIMLMIYPSYVEEEAYLQAGTVGIFNILKCLAVIIFAIIFYKSAVSDNKENKFYLNLNLMALALYVCFSFVPFLSRIGYYLTVSQIFFIPSVLLHVEGEKKQRIWKMLVIAGGIIYFALFLYKAGDASIKILPYKTWITERIEFLSVNKLDIF